MNKKNTKKTWCLRIENTSSRGRTGTMLPSLDFESSASANSAMLAYVYDNIHEILCQFSNNSKFYRKEVPAII